MSATQPRTSIPFECHSSTQAFNSLSFLAHVRILQPNVRPSSDTMAWPIPFVPPVTTAVDFGGRFHRLAFDRQMMDSKRVIKNAGTMFEQYLRQCYDSKM